MQRHGFFCLKRQDGQALSLDWVESVHVSMCAIVLFFNINLSQAEVVSYEINLFYHSFTEISFLFLFTRSPLDSAHSSSQTVDSFWSSQGEESSPSLRVTGCALLKRKPKCLQHLVVDRAIYKKTYYMISNRKGRTPSVDGCFRSCCCCCCC